MIITRIVHLRLLVLAHLAQAECHGRQCGWCGIFGIGVCSVSVLLYSIDSITSGKATAGCRIAGMTDWGTAAPRYSRKTGITRSFVLYRDLCNTIFPSTSGRGINFLIWYAKLVEEISPVVPSLRTHTLFGILPPPTFRF